MKITQFQKSLLRAIPLGKTKAGKYEGSLSTFYVQKALKITGRKSIKNFRSTIDCLTHKGLLTESEDGRLCLTKLGMKVRSEPAEKNIL